jgi:hypothetical protein
MRVWKQPKKYSTPRKYRGKCEHCNKKIADNEAYQYYDSSNIAISYNAPYLCRECYIKEYGK